MLEETTRIPPVDVEMLPDDLREALEEQRKLRGAPLYPYLFYARNPAFFRAAQGMWAALQQGTKRVPGTLRALLARQTSVDRAVVADYDHGQSNRRLSWPWRRHTMSNERVNPLSTARPPSH